ncbi:hypothetical protein TNCV_1880911 [Trichonephila clavipes]|nr:hypothetical protein TNCV_1880911 [Trichonephila clavipes]
MGQKTFYSKVALRQVFEIRPEIVWPFLRRCATQCRGCSTLRNSRPLTPQRNLWTAVDRSMACQIAGHIIHGLLLRYMKCLGYQAHIPSVEDFIP